jgi:hypothetical protein
VEGLPVPLRVTVAPNASDAGASCPVMLKVVPVVVIPVALKLMVIVEDDALEIMVIVPVKAPVAEGKA